MKIALAVVVAMATAGLASDSICDELVINGSLENPAVEECVGNCVVSGIPGWQIPDDCSIDWVNSPAQCPECTRASEGSAFVDLCGSNASCGFIAQEITPVIGRRYRISFILGGNCGQAGDKNLTCRVGDEVIAEVGYECPPTPCASWETKPRIFEFIATTSPTMLRFEGSSANPNYGPLVDSVSVTPICFADITGDGQVDAADLGVLLAVWNSDGGTIPEADINGDGTVNASDLGLVLGAWGLCS